jgi:hypothetical protein
MDILTKTSAPTPRPHVLCGWKKSYIGSSPLFVGILTNRREHEAAEVSQRSDFTSSLDTVCKIKPRPCAFARIFSRKGAKARL